MQVGAEPRRSSVQLSKHCRGRWRAAIVGEAGLSASVFLESSAPGPDPIAGPDLDLVLRVSLITGSAPGPESGALNGSTLARIDQSLPWWPPEHSDRGVVRAGVLRGASLRSHGRKRRLVQPKHGKEHVRGVAPRLGMYSRDDGRRRRHQREDSGARLNGIACGAARAECARKSRAGA